MQTLSKDNTPKFIYVFGESDSRLVESFGSDLVAKWVGMNDDVWVYVYPFTDETIASLNGVNYLTTDMLYFGMSASALTLSTGSGKGVAR